MYVTWNTPMFQCRIHLILFHVFTLIIPLVSQEDISARYQHMYICIWPVTARYIRITWLRLGTTNKSMGSGWSGCSQPVASHGCACYFHMLPNDSGLKTTPESKDGGELRLMHRSVATFTFSKNDSKVHVTVVSPRWLSFSVAKAWPHEPSGRSNFTSTC